MIIPIQCEEKMLKVILLNCFWQVGGKKAILFVDEYDILESADDDARFSFLKAVRDIKAMKDNCAIWSINAIGTFSTLHLTSKEVTTSPFMHTVGLVCLCENVIQLQLMKKLEGLNLSSQPG
ncbi:unnamed protein product [Rhizophagus irregularis]|uniref:Uncharacterized protein n=1 Tax=Rhizophagus irregularis TaxID=588596 RepID=A0A2N1NHU1_9GLOM|nr:hypothetical protein RhiirC2_709639 [Rhizophagus irregularis]CAB4381405.1 unnamed protein product [Rhizophagus irregularis]